MNHSSLPHLQFKTKQAYPAISSLNRGLSLSLSFEPMGKATMTLSDFFRFKPQASEHPKQRWSMAEQNLPKPWGPSHPHWRGTDGTSPWGHVLPGGQTLLVQTWKNNRIRNAQIHGSKKETFIDSWPMTNNDNGNDDDDDSMMMMMIWWWWWWWWWFDDDLMMIWWWWWLMMMTSDFLGLALMLQDVPQQCPDRGIALHNQEELQRCQRVWCPQSHACCMLHATGCSCITLHYTSDMITVTVISVAPVALSISLWLLHISQSPSPDYLIRNLKWQIIMINCQ